MPTVDLYDLNSDLLYKNFSSYVARLINESNGIGLPKGYVPHPTYGLIDNDEFIGCVDIRHSLTENLLRQGEHIGYDIRPLKRNQGNGKKILKLALLRVKELRITKVLVTCDDTNLWSKKIIEASGGILENSVEMGKGKPRKLRYWIGL
jgi:predicted acetyltransferase